MKAIYIGKRMLERPIIQGGMGIGVSRCRLAGAVAKEGGMGVISTAQVGYDHPDFKKDPEAANLKVLPEQIREAKRIADGRGWIGVNIMSVTQLYGDYVRTACEAGVDAIISGAGLPTNLPELVKGTGVKIAPIVSSERSAGVILKYWDKKYGRTADFLVIEGPKAGGHLGFTREELAHIEELDYDREIQKIIAFKEIYEVKYGVYIPVFVAGGIFTKEDVDHALMLGADGVQAATRFVATEECDASQVYKEAYIAAKKEDVVIIQSPVGMPGRAIRNTFVREMEHGSQRIDWCYNCLKACNPKKASYCISQALINAVEGDLEHGLIFCGERVEEIREITTVKQIMAELDGLQQSC